MSRGTALKAAELTVSAFQIPDANRRLKAATRSKAMGTVVDMMTRRPIDVSDREWSVHVDLDVPRQERLIFDVEPLPKRMVRIAATVPAECLGIVGEAWRRAMIEAGAVKPKATKRRAAK
ncbi:hypothetical protein [Mesorhizobium marinum]|uniref:hypothetical protein n=1 Tax=Mesorhizobium marinum TaxID=3228790 RepID=UPI003466F168